MKKEHWITLLMISGIILLYFILTEVAVVLDPTLFPPLKDIVLAMVDSMPELLESLVSSSKLLFSSFLTALVSGISLGLLISLNKILNKAVEPIVFALNSVPPSMLTPYLIAVLPTFYLASSAVIFIGGFWSILNGTLNGVRSIEKKYLDNSKLLEIKGVTLVRKVILPASAPSILAGIKGGLNFSFILLPIAEMFAVNSGLGYFIQYYADFSEYDRVICGILFMAFYVVVIMIIFERLRKRILHWTSTAD